MAGKKEISKIVMRAIRLFVAPVVNELVLFLTIVLTLVPHSIDQVYRYLSLTHRLPSWLPPYLLGSVSVAVLVAYLVSLMLYGIGRRRRLYKVLKTVIYLSVFAQWLVVLFLRLNFNTYYSPQVLTLIAETNKGEAREFLGEWLLSAGSVKAVVIWLATVAVVIMGERLCYRKSGVSGERSGESGKISAFGVVAVAGMLVFVLGYGVKTGSKIVKPYHSLYELEIVESEVYSNDVISNIHESAVMLYFRGSETKRAIAVSLNAARYEPIAAAGVDSLTIVLVIGESYNKHHSSLYGYPLTTSPYMTAERDNGNLTIMTDAVSPYNLTSSSLKDLFSLSSVAAGEKWFERPMWTAVMRRAGWRVVMWDNQRDYLSGSVFTFSLNSLLYDNALATAIYTTLNDSTFAYDEELVDNYASRGGNVAVGRDVVIFHLMGQHTRYRERYPDAWNRFVAADVPAKGNYLDDGRRQTIACYDNATLYNDYVLKKIVDLYRDRDAVVIMLSDHGEEVYDYRDFMERDHDPQKTWEMLYYENQIPMFIWYSNGFKRRFPDKVQAIRSSASRPLMLDAMGQIVMWLAGIEGKAVVAERNVFSPKYISHHRLLYDATVDYDSLLPR